MALNLTVFDIIKGPIVSEKALELNKELKQLVLKVHPQANKTQIKEALQHIFSVKVERVNTLIRQGKTRRNRRTRTVTESATTKRAIVTLKKGYTIDLFDQSPKGAASKVQSE
jgi:large subunit ribosomal protein L23